MTRPGRVPGTPEVRVRNYSDAYRVRQGRVPGTPRGRLGYVSGTRQDALLYMPKTVLLYGSLVLTDNF